MIKPITFTTIAAALACSATFADEQEKEVVKSETNNGKATANAVAKGTSTTTTNINGKSVTIMEDLDDNGKKRIRMITYENGKPKVKDITPKEKEQAKKEDAFWKKKTAGGAEEKRTTAFGTSSNSSSSSSYTDGSGNTVTTTTTERDGKRETRRTVTGPDGKVVSDTNGDDDAAAEPEAKPTAQGGKPGGPWLGVHTVELPPAMREQLDLPAGTGLLVEQLASDSPAGSAGIAQHDILLTFNLNPVSTPEQLRAELSNCQPGENVLVEYLHKSRREKASVTLGKRAATGKDDAQKKAAEPVAKVDNQQDKAAAQQGKLPEGFGGFPKLDIPGLPDLSKLPSNGGKTESTTSSKSFSRTVIVGPDGKTRVIENNSGGDPIEQMLRDPNVPATMKDSLRKMQEQMRDFQKRTDGVAPGNAKPGKEDGQ